MDEVLLHTRNDHYVATVLTPPFEPRAEIIKWGSRCFVCGTDGTYREALVWNATTQRTEP